jgi:hypothetical protein
MESQMTSGGASKRTPQRPQSILPRRGKLPAALAEALRTEYRAIIDAGLDLQVDNAFSDLPHDY